MSKSYAKYKSVGYVVGHERRNANGKFYHKRIKILRNKNKMKLRQAIYDNVDFIEIKQCRKNLWIEPTDGTKIVYYNTKNLKSWGKIYTYKNKIKK